MHLKKVEDFSLKNIGILHYIITKQDVSVLPFQKLFKWKPRNEEESFGVFYGVERPLWLESVQDWILLQC